VLDKKAENRPHQLTIFFSTISALTAVAGVMISYYSLRKPAESKPASAAHDQLPAKAPQLAKQAAPVNPPVPRHRFGDVPPQPTFEFKSGDVTESRDQYNRLVRTLDFQITNIGPGDCKMLTINLVSLVHPTLIQDFTKGQILHLQVRLNDNSQINQNYFPITYWDTFGNVWHRSFCFNGLNATACDVTRPH
jgi:hypothetical protein